jgi:hypothetical protein
VQIGIEEESIIHLDYDTSFYSLTALRAAGLVQGMQSINQVCKTAFAAVDTAFDCSW